MMKSFVTGILLSFLAPLTVTAIDPASVELNNKGMDHYDEREFVTACEQFLKALEIDDSNYMAHYNLACTMCLLREEWSPCGFYPDSDIEFDILQDTILYHLDRSVQLNERRRQRMVEDPDLARARTALRFHQIAGRSLTVAADAKAIIPAVNWRLNKDIDTPGSWDTPSGTVGFTREGRFTIELYDEERFAEGRYSIIDGTLSFEVTNGNFTIDRFMGEITENNIVIPDFYGYDLVIWSTTEECGT